MHSEGQPGTITYLFQEWAITYLRFLSGMLASDPGERGFFWGSQPSQNLPGRDGGESHPGVPGILDRDGTGTGHFHSFFGGWKKEKGTLPETNIAHDNPHVSL